MHVRLGPPLGSQRYPIGRRMKTVDYWTGRAVGDDDVSLYRPNHEIDQVAWVRIDKAEAMLSYDYDRETLAEAVKVRRRTHPIVVLRHAQARSRNAWKADDQLRPLLKTGAHDAERLVPLLAAYNLTRVVSSPSIRCLQTVAPYAEMTGWDIETRRRLAEEDVTAKGIEKVIDELLDGDQGAVVCTHRPVLPDGVRRPRPARRAAWGRARTRRDAGAPRAQGQGHRGRAAPRRLNLCSGRVIHVAGLCPMLADCSPLVQAHPNVALPVLPSVADVQEATTRGATFDAPHVPRGRSLERHSPPTGARARCGRAGPAPDCVRRRCRRRRRRQRRHRRQRTRHECDR